MHHVITYEKKRRAINNQIVSLMSKRPHAEMSASAQPSTMVRVEQLEFTLFKAADLEEIDASFFDGQLSDCSSLSDESIWSLNLSDSCDEDIHEQAGIGSNVPLGNWTGTRPPSSNSYLLKDNKNLSGPDPPDWNPKPAHLDDIQKRVVKNFCKNLTSHWPSDRLSRDLAEEKHLGMADPTVFWNVFLETDLPLFITYYDRQPQAHKSIKVC